MDELKYKVGDKVRIKSLDWYNENKDEYGNVPLVDFTKSNYNFNKRMRGLCGKVVTISSANKYNYDMVEDNGVDFWTNEMIEGLVEDESIIDLTVKGEEIKERIEIAIPEGYEYVIESSKIIFIKKKKEYPKTYEECLSVLGIYNGLPDVEIYNAKPSECTLFQSLIRLKRCRDAYWKIAGDEMGLSKPWKPDWNDADQKRYVIAYFCGNIEKSRWDYGYSTILTFPTEEMRDAFYENFKEEIEICKELL